MRDGFDNEQGWTNRALIALAVLSMLPFALAAIPEMPDAPNHVARIHILAEGAGNADLARWFTIDWRWIGNLGIDLPALALAPLIGVENAVRLLSALIAPLTILGIWMLSRAGHGRFTGMAALSLPFALSQTLLWGFINYDMAAAWALIVAALWLRRPPEGVGRALLFGLLALLVWAAHAMGWALLLLLIGGFEIARCGIDPRRIVGRLPLALPLFVPLIPMALWRTSGAAPIFRYDSGIVAMKLMNFATMLRGTSKPVDLAMIAAIGLLAGFALLRVRRLEPRLAGAGALALAAALLLPATMMDSWAADLRLTPFAVMAALLAIRPQPAAWAERLLLVAGAALLIARIGLVAIAWHGADIVHRPQLALLDRVPRGSRLAFAAIEKGCGFPWPLVADHHLGSYAIARRDAFANTMFIVRGADLVSLKQPHDREHWSDRSQDMGVTRCTDGAYRPEQLAGRLAAMAAEFDMVWIVSLDGTPIADLPAVPGLRVVGRAPGSVLLGK